MVKTRFSYYFFLVILFAALTNPASAADGFYIVGNIGESTFHDAEDSLNEIAIDYGGFGQFPRSQSQEDDSDTTWRLGGGYQVNQYFSFEAAYVDFGESEVTGSGFLSGVTFDPVPEIGQSITSQLRGFEISGLGELLLGNQISATARVGLAYLEQDTSQNVFSVVPNRDGSSGSQLRPDLARSSKTDQTDFHPLLGIGLRYQAIETLSFHLEWVRYLDAIDLGNSESNVDNLSLGFRYSF